jgi:hypothetical protein
VVDSYYKVVSAQKCDGILGTCMWGLHARLEDGVFLHFKYKIKYYHHVIFCTKKFYNFNTLKKFVGTCNFFLTHRIELCILPCLHPLCLMSSFIGHEYN